MKVIAYLVTPSIAIYRHTVVSLVNNDLERIYLSIFMEEVRNVTRNFRHDSGSLYRDMNLNMKQES
jgi:hypothetical protein